MIQLYFKIPPTQNRYLAGDRHLIDLARKLFRKSRTSGVKKVFENLCLGLDELGVPYQVNQPFKTIQKDDAVIVLGVGRDSLKGYQQPNRIIAGIGLITHPAEWPNLFHEYPVAKYLQHSVWCNNLYSPYYGASNCAIWPAGINTAKWAPVHVPKKFDFLIYNKIMWEKSHTEAIIKKGIIDEINFQGLSYREIAYGQYDEDEYQGLLKDCRAMIFLCEHESQGFACCEALSMDVPVLAWNQGYWLDPSRFKWNSPVVKATSVPYFDERCGASFTDILDFNQKLNIFWENVTKNQYHPRSYIIENITLKKSAEKMLTLVSEVYTPTPLFPNGTF